MFFLLVDAARKVCRNDVTTLRRRQLATLPELSFKTSEFEFFGASFPSAAVGGDLVDVVAANGRWFGYVADVSGHGVPRRGGYEHDKERRSHVACFQGVRLRLTF